MTQEKTWNVANRMHSQKDSDNPAMNHIMTGADEIYDDEKGAKQSDINAQTDVALADRYTKRETYSKEQLDSLITTPDVNYVSVVATNATTSVTDILPATGEANTIYRVGNWNGTQYDPTMYALYAWNGTTYVCLAVRSFVGEVYDISVNHPDGQGNPTPYADLTEALGTDGENIPVDIRRGGMSIKFIQGNVQSSDNKYVQYRLMSDSFNTTPANWQGVDDEPTAGSRNLVESGGVYERIRNTVNSYDNTSNADLDFSDEHGNVLVRFANGHIKSKNFDSSKDATENERGLMTSQDKAKLNTVEEGAEVNAVTTVEVLENTDIDFSDVEGNVVMRVANGHIKTKNFDSDKIIKTQYDVYTSDLDISDEQGNVVARFNNGHIKTKNFDSANLSPIEPEPQSGDMNLNIIEYNKENCIGSYWYYPQVVSNDYIHKKLYWGFTDSNGYAGVCCADLFNHSITKNKLKRLVVSGGGDTHNNTFVDILPDRRIICGYSTGHNADNYLHIRISSKKEDITFFDAPISIDMGAKTTYGQYFYVAGKHYVFVRTNATSWSFTSSEDLVNWSEPHVLISAQYQYYLELKPITDMPNMLRMAMYSNPAYRDTAIRLGYIDFSTGNVLNADHTTVVGTIDGQPINNTDFDVLVAKPSTGKQRLSDLKISPLDDVEISFTRVSDLYDGVYYVYMNGTIHEICDAGEVLLLSTSYVNSGTWFIDGNKLIVSRSSKDTTGYDYVELWENDGTAWNKVKELYKELKGEKHIRNIYPLIDKNLKYFVWQRGYYDINSYKNFETDNIVYDLDNEIYF